MATIIEEVKLVFADVTDNHNKVWYGILYDNDDCETRWGRIGYDLQSKIFPAAGKRFLDKKKVEKEKKGYTELKVISNLSGSVSNISVAKSDLHHIATTQLIKSSNPTLERLIKRLVEANVHKITSNTQITYNSTTGLFATPLGIVNQNGLNEARNLLAELAPLIRNKSFGKLADSMLSSYLRIIPQSIGMKRFSTETLIPDDTALQKQMDLLDSLESSYQATQNTTITNVTPNTLQETVFSVDMDILTDMTERARLDRFFESSKKHMHGYNNVHVKEIFKIAIHDMKNNFENKTTPITETFHGTSQANCLSILKSGLKISPPSTAAIAGKMFGNGIYGAINSTKSLGYTYGKWGQGSTGDSGWLFICDFAMGKIFETKTTCSKPSKYDSVWAKAGGNLYNDELIVYRNSQVNIKYLLECK